MKVSPQQYAQAWYLALKETKEDQWEAISQTLLRRLQKEGNQSMISEIVRLVTELENQDLGQVEVQVRTAKSLDDSIVHALVKDLFQVEGVQATITQDESLVGGIVLETKDQRWDLSVKHQLEQLKSALKA